MNMKEFYQKIEGDYEGIVGRLGSDAMIQRFVLKFVDEKSYGELMAAVEMGSVEEALSSAHKMKGVVANLSFDKMFEILTRLLAWLRQENQDTIHMGMIQELKEEYDYTIQQIQAL